MGDSAEIGIIGGSGLYRLLRNARSARIETPFGDPSGPVTLAEWKSRRVAFIPRHGENHQHAPHTINYRANIHAFSVLGVTRILAPCAVGSLRADRRPGDVVVCDQFIDRTAGQRSETFYDSGPVAHVSAARPYCDELRPLAVRAAQQAGMTAHDGGTVVVIRGPRFSSAAESRWHAAMGGDVVNMTQYPEVILAREAGICYVALALVTDYDSGLEDDAGAGAVTQEHVMRVFAERTGQVRTALGHLVAQAPAERTCACAAGRAQALNH